MMKISVDPPSSPGAGPASTLYAIVAAFWCLYGATIAAQAQSLDDADGTLSFVWENDYFARTDRNYTNGLRLAYLSAPRPLEGLPERLARALFGADEDSVVRRGFAIGHSIFTPDDTDAVSAPADQHPYAGWLYGEYSSVIEHDAHIDQISLQLGVVGPSAGGEQVQNRWHRLFGGDTAKGWDDQIDDELGVALSYDRTFRRIAEIGSGGRQIDVTPTFGATVGNVRVNARAGMTVRYGQDLRNDYGPPRIRPSLAGGGYFAPRNAFSWYVFAGAEARLVAHSIFLDGSLFRDDDPSVGSRTFVGDLQAGLALQFRRVQVAYTQVVRTQEFDAQVNRHRFGAISVSAKF